MKIAITASGKNLDDPIDNRFGRAKGFLIIDNETDECKYQDNIQNLQSTQGAGIQSAKYISDAGAHVLITGHVGPKAFKALTQAGIKIYIGAKGSIKEAISDYKSGTLTLAEKADVEGHW